MPEALYSLRPATSSDDGLLRQIFEAVRVAEFAGVNLGPEQKALFFDQQYRLQSNYYREHFPNASHDIILTRGEPAGRLYVDRSDEEINVVDLCIVPEHWSAELIRSLLGAILSDARERQANVTASIEQLSPELEIYESMGFQRVAREFVNFRLEWSPANAPAGSNGSDA